jgi:hypothetical protein
MQSLIAALVSFFLLEPLQGEIADKLAAARAPQALIAEITSCARTAAPAVVERSFSDPWWAAAGALRVWAGAGDLGELLVEAAPGCAGAVRSARPYLTNREA